MLGSLNTILGLVDEDGYVVEAYRYDTYGAPQTVEDGGTGNPYRFTGRRLDFNEGDPAAHDHDVVLYHYRARAYDALHGRFLQRDPAGYGDGMNLYEYVRSRPTKVPDPSGFQMEGITGDDLVNRTFDARGAMLYSGLLFGGYYQTGDTILTQDGAIAVLSDDLWPFASGTNLHKANCVLSRLGFALPRPENGIYWGRMSGYLDGYTISGVGAFWNYVAASFVNSRYNRPAAYSSAFRELAITLYHELKGHNQDREGHPPWFNSAYEQPIRDAWANRAQRKTSNLCCHTPPNGAKPINTEMEKIMCNCAVVY